jgi:hypothetical protein
MSGSTVGGLFRPNLNQKPGVFQPVTGQAVVVVTTCVDDAHVARIGREQKSRGSNDGFYPLRSGDKNLVSRVESHCIALKKKNARTRYFKGSGCDLKIFTALNGLERNKILDQFEHVGVVQTPINPNDKTKPQGFRTNATRVGGTVSLINTGRDDIYPNMPIYWDIPYDTKDPDKLSDIESSECGVIKGHPDGIIYPATKMLTESDELREIIDAAGDPRTRNAQFKEILSKRRRVIGWSLNHCKPGDQLDLLLRR